MRFPDLVLLPPPTKLTMTYFRASASSVRSFLVGVPFVVVVVDPLRERASVRQFQSCFLPFHSPLSEERKRQRGKKDKGPSKSRRRPVSIQASLLLLLLSSFLSKVCRFSPSTHISLPRGARDKVRLTKKNDPPIAWILCIISLGRTINEVVFQIIQ